MTRDELLKHLTDLNMAFILAIGEKYSELVAIGEDITGEDIRLVCQEHARGIVEYIDNQVCSLAELEG